MVLNSGTEIQRKGISVPNSDEQTQQRFPDCTAGRGDGNGAESRGTAETPLGGIVAYKATDPEHPGVYIDLIIKSKRELLTPYTIPRII